MNTSSAKTLIASGLVAEVEHCAACDILHLHLGAFTLRIRPAALHDLRDTLNRALDALPAHRETHGAAAAHPPGGTCH